jgi:hypothetical protein
MTRGLWTNATVLYPNEDKKQDEGLWGRIWVMVGGCRIIFYKGVGKESGSTKS